MLSGLSKVDWSKTEHNGGVGTDVPDLLRALADESQASSELLGQALLRRRSLFEVVCGRLAFALFENGIWSASAAAVPFLLQLVESDIAASRRVFALEALHGLATGCRPQEAFPAKLDLGALLARVEEQSKRDPPQPVALVDDEVINDEEAFDSSPWSGSDALYEFHCYSTVEQALPVIRKCLQDVNDGVVSAAIALLAEYPATEASTQALWAVTRDEDDTHVGGQALVALAQLQVSGVGQAAQVMIDAVGDEHVGSLFAAAADVLGSAPTVLSPSSVLRLLTVPEPWLELPCPFTGSVAKLRHRALTRVSKVGAGELVRVLEALMPGATGFAQKEATALLFRVGMLDARDLGDTQRRALRLLVDHGHWGKRTVSMLRELGLPPTRDGLRARL